MSESQNLDELLIEVAKLAELDEVIRVQEDRTAWLLGLDDEETVLAEWQEATRRMLFMLEIGPLPDQGRERWLREVLYYNLLWQQTGGARIALLPPEDRLQLLLDVPAEQLGATQIVNVLDNLRQITQAWRETLNADAEGAVAEETAASSLSDDRSFFIRV